MSRIILRRLLYAVLVLIGVNLLTFVLFFAVNTPDDMARLNIGGKRVDQESIERWKAERGYDKPLLVNAAAQGLGRFTDTVFFERSLRLFVFDFGTADNGRDIAGEIWARAGPSLALAIPTFVLGVFASIAFALLLVFFRRTYLDFWGVVLCVAMLSISSLFYIIMGQFLFSKLLRLVPISGYEGGFEAWRFLLMPVLITVLARLGAEARLYRGMVLEEIGKDYVRTARAKGLSEPAVLMRHVLRNALIPIITSTVALIPLLFLGSLVSESFFAIPGLGSYTIEAINGQDFAVVRAMVFVGSLLYIIGLWLTDVAYTLADPRIRFA